MPDPISRFLTGILRLFFRLLYHELAWAYDFVAGTVSIGRWKDWTYATLPYLTGPNILELGHGPGHLQIALGQRGFHPIGLDESKQMGTLAYRRLHRQKLSPRLVNGYAQSIPFSTGRFSHVVATFPSEYIFEKETAGEIYRVLVPGGTAVILPFAMITGVEPLGSPGSAALPADRSGSITDGWILRQPACRSIPSAGFPGRIHPT